MGHHLLNRPQDLERIGLYFPAFGIAQGPVPDRRVVLTALGSFARTIAGVVHQGDGVAGTPKRRLGRQGGGRRLVSDAVAAELRCRS
jgi:hypothetical protein